MRRAAPKAISVLREVADEHGIGIARLMGRERVRPISRARQQAMLRLAEELDMSVAEIARLFDRDHTTVIYALKRARWRRELLDAAMGGLIVVALILSRAVA